VGRNPPRAASLSWQRTIKALERSERVSKDDRVTAPVIRQTIERGQGNM
jgi:hypothetical protein